MERIIVSAAIIKKDHKILIAQRKKGSHLELMWEFPGGKLEEGESPEECLQREIKEELNLNIKIEDIYQVVSIQYDIRNMIMLFYQCEVIDGVPECVECNDYRWVTLDEIKNYDFAPADLSVVEKLYKNNLSRTK